jgi:hypothetical protein
MSSRFSNPALAGSAIVGSSSAAESLSSGVIAIAIQPSLVP